MRYLSLFSGIEACSVAWKPLGWECVAVAEIEPWPSRALAHHYPDVPNLGDVTKVTEEQIAMLGRIDVVVFGSPCQDLSVAGKRKGLDGARSGLFFTAMQIVGWARQWCDCRFALWENVPGAFSSNAGRDFAAVVDAMAGLEGTGVPPKGWGTEGCALGSEAMVEWSTLDAQWFGVAQRRRRVFALADFGDWRNRPPILLESESMRGDTAPSREAGQDVAGGSARSTAGGGLGTDFDCDGGVVQVCPTLRADGNRTGGDRPPGTDVDTADSLVPVLSQCITTGTGQRYDPETETILPVTHSLRGEGFDASEDGAGRGTPLGPMFLHTNKGRPDGRRSAHTEMVSVKDIVETLTTDGHAQSAVAVPVAYGIRTANTSSNGWGIQEECTHTLDCAQGVAVAQPVAYAIQAGALRVNPASGPDGIGVQADHAYTLEARAEVQVVAFAENSRAELRLEGGATAELGDEVQNCLRASSGGGDKQDVLCETLYNKGLNHGGLYASTQETHTGKILRTLREAVGEEAFAQWGLGILGSLQSPEILRQALHGLSIRPAAFSRSWVVHCALSRAENGSGWLLQSLREAGCERCASQGWEPSEQLAGKLGAYLSELSQPGAQASRFVRDLWWAAQGPGLLREALSAVQEVGRPTHGQSQPAHGGMQVRRLTVEECEFLQGFPRGYTAIPWRGKPADQCPDGPRYKALGNSMAVPVMRWIGQSIDYAMIWSTP